MAQYSKKISFQTHCQASQMLFSDKILLGGFNLSALTGQSAKLTLQHSEK